MHCEGRRLPEGSPDPEAPAGGLGRAPWETIEFTLIPGAELREGS